MKKTDIDKIKQSFSVQAKRFESGNMNFSKQEYLDYTMMSIDAKKSDCVLEVAAGTCVCGRSLAPMVDSIICIDATPEMLEVGKNEAKKANLTNISFVEGVAENLPFEDNSFDIVMTRLSFHHFTEMETPFSEMSRVLRPGGKLVIIDMEATEEALRESEDEIETLRDFSHVKNRSKEEFISLYKENQYTLIKVESTPISVELSAWMELTNTSKKLQTDILQLMQNDINGMKKTGFYPYQKEGVIYFNQRWLLLIGIKA